MTYDDHETSKTIILKVHQALFIEEIQTNLLCAMQMRMNDVRVDEAPKFLMDDPTDQSHALTFMNSNSYIIPLSLEGLPFDHTNLQNT
jgi:hypothetical protein